MLIGVALVSPGFVKDLSTWYLTIDRNGTLIQTLSPAYRDNIYDRVSIEMRTFIDPATLSLIKTTAEEQGFFLLRDEYPVDYTDMPVYSITLPHGESFKRVVVHGSGMLANGDAPPVELEVFTRLWDIVAYLAPYRSITLQKANPDEVRRYNERFLGKK